MKPVKGPCNTLLNHHHCHCLFHENTQQPAMNNSLFYFPLFSTEKCQKKNVSNI
nr:MAG TPA: DNA polymerase III, alpha subunit-structure, naturally occurring, TRANSFERASE.5A [Caudoviricetes sp.]